MVLTCAAQANSRRTADPTRALVTSMEVESVILVVDDDAQLRATVRDALTAEPGLRVVEADNGEDGLLLAWQLAPALILIDLMMPGIDGATFCRILRAHPTTAGTRVVAVSGADPSDARAGALRELCDAWLDKPFIPRDLPMLARTWIDGGADQLGPRPTPAWAPLSRREWDVAALVALGLTNYQIARRLVLTPGTVANHVGRILRKLKIGSRTELAVWITTDAVRRSAAGLG